MSGERKRVAPVVGNRFRCEDGGEVTITVAVLLSDRVMYVGGGGECYDSEGRHPYRPCFDLIEDLGPAGDGA